MRNRRLHDGQSDKTCRAGAASPGRVLAGLALVLAACSDEPDPSYPYVPSPDAGADGQADVRLDSTVTDTGVDAPTDQQAPATRLEVWAPNATAVACVGSFGGAAEQSLTMEASASGFWSVDVGTTQPGDPYLFRLTTSEGQIDRLDPRALQRNAAGTRSVIGPGPYAWAPSEAAFERPTLREAVVYEMHAGTYNDEPGGQPGSLIDAADRLDHLADLGVNVVELLPITDFPGEYSWGYNPQLPYVVDEVYGGPDALHAFVQAAHARGIAVVLDVVYNHLSVPNPLCAYDGEGGVGCGGIYFYEDEYPETPWGPRFDYDRPEVRDYLLDNAWMWIERFHVDGFRWDSTGNIRATNHGQGEPIPAGETFLREANEALHEGSPGLISIAEDLSGSEALVRPVDEGGYGFDAQWDAGFHSLVVAELERAGSDPPQMTKLREALLAGGVDPFSRVVYTESHDSTGKLNDHVRLPRQLDPADPESIRAQQLSAVALALTLTAPGVPMILQGQELLEPGTFHDDEPVDWSRASSRAGFLQLARDLLALRRNAGGNTKGLQGEGIHVQHLNEDADVMAFHRFDAGGPGDDVIVAVSLSPNTYPTYRVGVPRAGLWQVRVDTSHEAYALGHAPGAAGPASYQSDPAPYDGMDANVLVSLAPYGLLVLSQDD